MAYDLTHKAQNDGLLSVSKSISRGDSGFDQADLRVKVRYQSKTMFVCPIPNKQWEDDRYLQSSYGDFVPELNKSEHSCDKHMNMSEII